MAPDRSTRVVLVASAILLGAACGGPRPSRETAAFVALVALGAAAAFRNRPWASTALLTAAALACGGALQAHAWSAASVRLGAVFGGELRIESERTGAIVGAPRRRPDGSRVLVVDLDARAGASCRVQLEIAPPRDDDRPRLDALRRGDTVRLWCRLRAPRHRAGEDEGDVRRRLAARGLDATGTVKSSRLVELVRPGSWSIERSLDQIHAALSARLDRALVGDPRTRAVLGAMLLGDRELLADEDMIALRDAGLVHILSISGLHTSMTVLALLGLMRRAGVGSRGMIVTGLLAAAAFAGLVTSAGSVSRACAGLAVMLLARAAGREIEAHVALALSAAALVVASPVIAFDIGFQLSVVATAGLLAFLPPSGQAGVVARSLAASGGAYAATMPLLAASFGRLAPAGLIANLLAAPLCAASIATGAGVLLASDHDALAAVASSAARGAVTAMLAVARASGRIPAGHFRVASPGGVLVGAYVAAWLACVLAKHRRAGLRRWLGLATLLVALAIHIGPPPPGSGDVGAEVLDVGQGLSVLLGSEDGSAFVYDAGPAAGGRFDAGDRIVGRALVDRGYRRLDALALSHDHDDHAGGAATLLRDFDVGELWLAAGTEHDALASALAESAVARGVAVRRLRRGDLVRAAGFPLEVLHPSPDDRRRPLNDRCLVLRATVSGATLLLPGDLEAAGEESLLRSGIAPRAEAMIAPHHGSDGSSTAAFLAAVAPDVVVVSVGEGNRFGHPGAAAMGRIARQGALVFRTDRDGAVRLRAVSGSWRASAENDRRRDEGEDEDQDEDDRDRDAARPERLAFGEQVRVPPP